MINLMINDTPESGLCINTDIGVIFEIALAQTILNHFEKNVIALPDTGLTDIDLKVKGLEISPGLPGGLESKMPKSLLNEVLHFISTLDTKLIDYNYVSNDICGNEIKTHFTCIELSMVYQKGKTIHIYVEDTD